MEVLPLFAFFIFLAHQTAPNEAIKKSYHTTEPTESNVNYTNICTDLLRNSFFDLESVVDVPWMIYYTFNMKLQASTTCLSMTFKLITPEIIERIKSDMRDFLESQPAWHAATMLLTIGGGGNEVLLVSDQGPAGKFLGVQGRKGVVNLIPPKRALPLLHYTIKLFRGGKFLIIMDCQIGVATLAGHAEKPLDLEQVTPVLEELKTLLGPGARVCKDPNPPEEMFPVILD